MGHPVSPASEGVLGNLGCLVFQGDQYVFLCMCASILFFSTKLSSARSAKECFVRSEKGPGVLGESPRLKLGGKISPNLSKSWGLLAIAPSASALLPFLSQGAPVSFPIWGDQLGRPGK